MNSQEQSTRLRPMFVYAMTDVDNFTKSNQFNSTDRTCPNLYCSNQRWNVVLKVAKGKQNRKRCTWNLKSLIFCMLLKIFVFILFGKFYLKHVVISTILFVPVGFSRDFTDFKIFGNIPQNAGINICEKKRTTWNQTYWWEKCGRSTYHTSAQTPAVPMQCFY